MSSQIPPSEEVKRYAVAVEHYEAHRHYYNTKYRRRRSLVEMWPLDDWEEDQ